ncbi:hypothetical protein [Actinomadura verrucosospora]|uniref:Uncharacterized protein n=1 Tax=Actinomadura verrucosospora TaxID=46165 RepID=A0A7D3VYB9_ACTVE|nr:hypothetical protein [Actinomadura verrucosospora]QKG26735.1 hypothetical protein ACTIVE_8388 [Actinomadura verrucosospora]
MATKPLAEVALADLATKDDLKGVVSKDHFDQQLGSAVNLLMGEIGKIAARQEEMAGVLAGLVARSEGVTR